MSLEQNDESFSYYKNAVKNLDEYSVPGGPSKELTATSDFSSSSIENLLNQKSPQIKIKGFRSLKETFASEKPGDPEFFEKYSDKMSNVPLIANPMVLKEAVECFKAFSKKAPTALFNEISEKTFSGTVSHLLASPKFLKEGTEIGLQLFSRVGDTSQLFNVLDNIGFKNKRPMVAAGSVKFLTNLLRSFGPFVAKPDFCKAHISELFSAHNPQIRKNTMELAREMYRWGGKEFLDFSLLRNLKKAQITALNSAIENVVPKSAKLDELEISKTGTKTEKKEILKKDSNNIWELGNSKSQKQETPPPDKTPHIPDQNILFTQSPNYASPTVDLVPKLNSNPDELTALPKQKWQVKKEFLMKVAETCKRHQRLELVSERELLLETLSQTIKDLNINVALASLKALSELVESLGRKSESISKKFLADVLQRFREKRKTVEETCFQTLRAITKSGIKLSSIFHTVQTKLNDRVPRARECVLIWLREAIETKGFVGRDSKILLAKICVEIFNDGAAEVRAASFELFAGILEVLGEKGLQKMVKSLRVNESRTFKKITKLREEIQKTNKAKKDKIQNLKSKGINEAEREKIERGSKKTLNNSHSNADVHSIYFPPKKTKFTQIHNLDDVESKKSLRMDTSLSKIKGLKKWFEEEDLRAVAERTDFSLKAEAVERMNRTMETLAPVDIYFLGKELILFMAENIGFNLSEDNPKQNNPSRKLKIRAWKLIKNYVELSGNSFSPQDFIDALPKLFSKNRQGELVSKEFEDCEKAFLFAVCEKLDLKNTVSCLLHFFKKNENLFLKTMNWIPLVFSKYQKLGNRTENFALSFANEIADFEFLETYSVGTLSLCKKVLEFLSGHTKNQVEKRAIFNSVECINEKILLKTDYKFNFKGKYNDDFNLETKNRSNNGGNGGLSLNIGQGYGQNDEFKVKRRRDCENDSYKEKDDLKRINDNGIYSENGGNDNGREEIKKGMESSLKIEIAESVLEDLSDENSWQKRHAALKKLDEILRRFAEKKILIGRESLSVIENMVSVLSFRMKDNMVMISRLSLGLFEKVRRLVKGRSGSHSPEYLRRIFVRSADGVFGAVTKGNRVVTEMAFEAISTWLEDIGIDGMQGHLSNFFTSSFKAPKKIKKQILNVVLRKIRNTPNLMKRKEALQKILNSLHCDEELRLIVKKAFYKPKTSSQMPHKKQIPKVPQSARIVRTRSILRKPTKTIFNKRVRNETISNKYKPKRDEENNNTGDFINGIFDTERSFRSFSSKKLSFLKNEIKKCVSGSLYSLLFEGNLKAQIKALRLLKSQFASLKEAMVAKIGIFFLLISWLLTVDKDLWDSCFEVLIQLVETVNNTSFMFEPKHTDQLVPYLIAIVPQQRSFDLLERISLSTKDDNAFAAYFIDHIAPFGKGGETTTSPPLEATGGRRKEELLFCVKGIAFCIENCKLDQKLFSDRIDPLSEFLNSGDLVSVEDPTVKTSTEKIKKFFGIGMKNKSTNTKVNSKNSKTTPHDEKSGKHTSKDGFPSAFTLDLRNLKRYYPTEQEDFKIQSVFDDKNVFWTENEKSPKREPKKKAEDAMQNDQKDSKMLSGIRSRMRRLQFG